MSFSDNEKPKDNPYYIPCAVKSLLIVLLSPLYISTIITVRLKRLIFRQAV